MALRHKLAVEAISTQDLLVIANFYISAVKEVLEEKGNPYVDGACRLIAFQVAFVGNGDQPFPQYYEKVMEYCIQRAHYDELGLTGKVINLNEPELPKIA